MDAYFVEAPVVRKLMRSARHLSRQIDRNFSAPARGWSLASYDPNLLLDAFCCLALRDGWQLAAYEFFDGENGIGFVFGIPAGHSLPDPEERFDFHWSPEGKPVFDPVWQSLPERMQANIGCILEGDGSPLSYFQASIFVRELQEMGSLFHGCSWAAHEVLTSAAQIPLQKWDWGEKRPRIWRPVVRNLGSTWQVTFYSYSGLSREQIVFHMDTFAAGYELETEETIVALGEGGYVL
jgi:hypothetical protein